MPAATTVAFIVITTFVALDVNDLGPVVDLLGATGAAMVAFVVPSVIYFRLFPTPRAAPLRVISAGLATFGAVFLGMGISLAFRP